MKASQEGHKETKSSHWKGYDITINWEMLKYEWMHKDRLSVLFPNTSQVPCTVPNIGAHIFIDMNAWNFKVKPIESKSISKKLIRRFCPKHLPNHEYPSLITSSLLFSSFSCFYLVTVLKTTENECSAFPKCFNRKWCHYRTSYYTSLKGLNRLVMVLCW